MKVIGAAFVAMQFLNKLRRDEWLLGDASAMDVAKVTYLNNSGLDYRTLLV